MIAPVSIFCLTMGCVLVMSGCSDLLAHLHTPGQPSRSVLCIVMGVGLILVGAYLT